MTESITNPGAEQIPFATKFTEVLEEPRAKEYLYHALNQAGYELHEVALQPLTAEESLQLASILERLNESISTTADLHTTEAAAIAEEFADAFHHLMQTEI